MIISLKDYNAALNNAYLIGRKDGVIEGKREALFEALTPNEIRELLGVPRIEEKENEDV